MAGLLEWSDAIRFTMANDPGREIFQGQLNTHGFIFLDDYLENILSGPSQDPIIELVKTPGRKKVASKKPKRLGSSDLRTRVSLKENEEPKENITPLNSLHKALLEAKGLSILDATDLPPSRQMVASDIFVASSGVHLDNQTQVASDSSTSDFPASGRLNQNDLSVIAEDDENLESNTHSRRNSDIPPSPPLHTLPEPRRMDNGHGHGDSGRSLTMTESSSDIFHSSTLDSPSLQVPERAQDPVDSLLSPMLPEVNPTKPIGVSEKSVSSPNVSLLNTAPGESRIESLDLHVPDTNTDSCDLKLPSQDSSQVSSSGDKFGVTLFPILPAPMPLRKSVRTSRDPSVSAGHTGATTPSAPPGGKRTSWLKKAREVKALEVTIKQAGTTLVAVPDLPSENVLKRKSIDLLMSSDTIALKDQGRNSKSVKSNETDEAPLKATPESESLQLRQKTPQTIDEALGQEGMLDRFKRTVEDLGARVGKSISKSLGAAAATSALAEARAAAEARVVERLQKEEKMTRVSGSTNTPPLAADIPFTNRLGPVGTISEEPVSEERRLSISDLFPPLNSKSSIDTTEHDLLPSPELHQPRDPPVMGSYQKPNRESTTTTPPDSPPTSRCTSSVPHPATTLGKPLPVFIPPVSTSNTLLHDYGMSLSSINAFPLPVPMSIGLGPRLQPLSSPKHTGPLSRQSTMESTQSDKIFDDTDSPAWMPKTQDTDYSLKDGSRSQNLHQTPIDGDDSWPVDAKPAAGVRWAFGDIVKEESTTWSTLPSQSQREDTGKYHSHQDDKPQENTLDHNVLSLASRIDIHGDFDEHVAHGDSDLEDIILHGQSTKAPQSESYVSMLSSQSHQSQTGFPGQTLRPLGSALGTSKKGNPDVKKVLQMAAVAAKKQQEENDKKTARLKEMENRRQLAIQRKAEEERTKTLEQERKVKEEGERRKREREENTDKRPTKAAVKKDEDNGKRRKVTSSDGKRETKKLPPKAILKSSSLKPPSALGSSTAYNVSLQNIASSSTLSDFKPLKPPATTVGTGQKGKGKAPTTPSTQDDLSQPSQLVQIQMAARAKAQIQTARLTSEPPVASESIELPDINSEYSDSDDEDRSKAFPGWAQSPELRQALQLQSTINPDDIFGAIRPLRMEEMFKTRTSRFRARTSSANWTGADRLTMEEEREYAKRMGFK
ncbi:hypothetical protein C0995_008769 [Termitomyces sp. Mi166|nr:hypothetical protein C0995_008769 [Termitomyces sp. Mi166\